MTGLIVTLQVVTIVGLLAAAVKLWRYLTVDDRHYRDRIRRGKR